jgi:hypothetical protein
LMGGGWWVVGASVVVAHGVIEITDTDECSAQECQPSMVSHEWMHRRARGGG